MFGHETAKTTTIQGISRRSALRSEGVPAGAAALPSAGSQTVNARQGRETLTLDIAMDGRTWRMNRQSEIGPPLMGDTFIVFGSIYPGGAFDEAVTGPDAAGAVGRWICRGTFLVDIASGAVPHVITTQQFVLGEGLSSSAGDLAAAADALLNIGFEGGVEEAHRTLSGGYGEYAGANGAVLETPHSTNETVLQLGPDIAADAPNYRFAFHFSN